jgi:di/tricarboxylate transporter
MTMEIGMVFAILGTAMLLFITGWIRADIVAVLVLVSLAATGLLAVEEVLKGFSSEAVIAIAGLLVLSPGLVRSGVVRWIAERLNDIAGGSRKRLTLTSSLVPGAAPLLVESPGSYETRDYLKFGAGLVAITLLVVAVLVPLMWPF